MYEAVGLIDGWMDGWMDRWVDRRVLPLLRYIFIIGRLELWWVCSEDQLLF
jgi:hypothetical protein